MARKQWCRENASHSLCCTKHVKTTQAALTGKTDPVLIQPVGPEEANRKVRCRVCWLLLARTQDIKEVEEEPAICRQRRKTAKLPLQRLCLPAPVLLVFQFPKGLSAFLPPALFPVPVSHRPDYPPTLSITSYPADSGQSTQPKPDRQTTA